MGTYLYQGKANKVTDGNSVNGVLLLRDDSLTFKPTKQKTKCVLVIPLALISSTEASAKSVSIKNVLVVNLNNGESLAFIVGNSKMWADRINNAKIGIASLKRKHSDFE